jgi:hypothetical protein
MAFGTPFSVTVGWQTAAAEEGFQFPIAGPNSCAKLLRFCHR